jgi:coproporphyrinogen III oxidase
VPYVPVTIRRSDSHSFPQALQEQCNRLIQQPSEKKRERERVKDSETKYVVVRVSKIYSTSRPASPSSHLMHALFLIEVFRKSKIYKFQGGVHAWLFE